MPVINSIAALAPEMREWRRWLHRHPELQFDLPQTSDFVADRLLAFGVDEIHEGIARSGIVAIIEGRGTGPTIGLRADMDALPILEATGAAHASESVGKMHACGHDGHTAMLLGAAQYLAETRNFDGTVVVIFQPAEEGGNGAKAMLDDGLVERFGIDEVYAIHNRPGLPVGQFAIRPGPQLAAADEFAIEVVGKGGHAAEPNLAVDPLVIACQIVVALQTIVSRNADPVAQTVVSVTSVETSSHAFNVISERARCGARCAPIRPRCARWPSGGSARSRRRRRRRWAGGPRRPIPTAFRSRSTRRRTPGSPLPPRRRWQAAATSRRW